VCSSFGKFKGQLDFASQDATEVRELFSKVQPSGVTNIGASLEKLLSEYIDKLDEQEEKFGKEAARKIKPVNYIVLTDGEASKRILLFLT